MGQVGQVGQLGHVGQLGQAGHVCKWGKWGKGGKGGKGGKRGKRGKWGKWGKWVKWGQSVTVPHSRHTPYIYIYTHTYEYMYIHIYTPTYMCIRVDSMWYTGILFMWTIGSEVCRLLLCSLTPSKRAGCSCRHANRDQDSVLLRVPPVQQRRFVLV